MATAMTEPRARRELGPGERAALAQEQSRRRTVIAMVGIAIAALVLLPAALGFADGLAGAPKRAPDWLRPVSAGLIILTAVIGGWVQWRQHDEVIRHRAINAYAVIGLIALFGFPLIGVLVPFGITLKPDLVWALAVVGGLATYLYQRRGG